MSVPPAPRVEEPHEPASRESRTVRDRHVVFAAAAAAAVVLGVELAGVLYPPLDRLLALAPTVVIVLVVVTVVILFRSIRSGGRS